MSLGAVIDEAIADLGTQRPSVNDLVDAVLSRAPDLIETEGARLLRRSIGRQVKDRLRASFDTDDDYPQAQLGLPGFEHVPAHLAVRGPTRIYYVPTRLATYGELAGAIEERRQHRQRVDVVLGELETLAALVEPVIGSQPADLTVADALVGVVSPIGDIPVGVNS